MNTKKIAFIAAMLSGAVMANANAADQARQSNIHWLYY